jgi:fructosamine-3-kinase
MSLRWYYYDCISSGSIGPQFQDYYDVIFEGYASAMPSPQELRSRVTWHGLVTSLAGGRERLGYSDFLLMNMEPV